MIKILFFIYFLFVFENYVIQTEDDFVHFIKDKIESFDFKSVLLKESKSKKLNELTLYKENNTAMLLEKPMSEGLQYFINLIKVQKDGTIIINGKSFKIENLVLRLLLVDNIFISTTQKHEPKIVNSTLFIINNYKVVFLYLITKEYQ